MSKIVKIHSQATPQRIHYLAEWIKHRRTKQAALVRALGEAGVEANKSTVSKWCAGALPSEKYLPYVAAFLEIEVNSLFHDPQDDWLAKLFRDRSADERERMIATLKAAFPSQQKAKRA